MPATIRASFYGGAATEPAGSSAETGVSLDRSDSQQGTEPVLIPSTSPGTAYSAVKQVALEVMTTSATTLTDATVRAQAGMPPGVAWMYRASSSYAAQLSNPGTLTADSALGANVIESSVAYAVGASVQIDADQADLIEVRQVTATSGGGPYTLTLDRPLLQTHTTGAILAQFTSAGPTDASAEASGGLPQIPTGFVLPTSAPVVYSPLGLSTATAGRIGPFVQLIGSLSTTYARIWSAHGVVEMPSLILGFDEH